MSDELITFGEPVIDSETDTRTYLWSDGEGSPIFRVRIEDTHEKDGAIYGDITAWYLLDQPLATRPVQPTTTLKLNSSHSTGWRSIPRELSKRLPGIDIEGAMTMAVHDEMEWFKQGDDAVRLGATVREGERPFVLDPFISSGGTTVMYGEGGLSKSLVALAMAISVSTGVAIFGNAPTIEGPVVYFDYEDDPIVHDLRLQAICRSFGIAPSDVTVYHVPLMGKVNTSKRMMTKKVQEYGAVLGILDSVGMGRGGNAVAAEDTIRMFRALRTIGVPFLAIDHVSKESKKNKDGDVDAYGSIYTMNSARLAWHLTRSHVADLDTIAMYAKNTKANHVRRQKSRMIEVKYINDKRGVPKHIEITVSDDFGMVRESVSVHQRMMMLLGRGPLTVQEMADELGMNVASIQQALSRDKNNTPPTFARDKSRKPMSVSLSVNPVSHEGEGESE
jgi:hypothetical protein